MYLAIRVNVTYEHICMEHMRLRSNSHNSEPHPKMSRFFSQDRRSVKKNGLFIRNLINQQKLTLSALN